ncbi:protein containing Peptidase M1, membrane alanine aminopeptidase, partial [mine drainage metagenome]
CCCADKGQEIPDDSWQLENEVNDDMNGNTTHAGHDSSASYRLSKVFEPVRYKLYLVPDLQAGSFRGNVRIEGRIATSTDVVELHAADLDITGVSTEGVSTDSAGSSIAWDYDSDAQVVRLKFSGTVEPGDIVLYWSSPASSRPS